MIWIHNGLKPVSSRSRALVPGWDQDRDGTRTRSILREALTFCHVSCGGTWCEAASVSRNAAVQTQRRRDSEQPQQQQQQETGAAAAAAAAAAWEVETPSASNLLVYPKQKLELEIKPVKSCTFRRRRWIRGCWVEAGSPQNQGRGSGAQS